MIVNKNAKSLEESVYLTLEDEILGGELKPGDTLTETALSARLGVSRTPLRGALHKLSEVGLVSISPNRGATVIGVTREDLIDIYKIRKRLEGLASASAASRISDEDKEALLNSIELSEFYIKKNNTEKLKELDSEFHNIIYKASGNRLLSKILSELHSTIRVYRKISLSVHDRLKKSLEEHREIYTAIINGDADLADKLTCEHIDAALNNLLSVSKDQGEK